MQLWQREDKLRKEFFQLQRYGAKKAEELKITKKDIKKMIFEDR
jgi:hypothetical protein